MKALAVILSACLLAVVGWGLVDSNSGIPPRLAHILTSNSYRVTEAGVSGTTVWVDSRHLLTNCHVIHPMGNWNAKNEWEYSPMKVYSHDGIKIFRVRVVSCGKRKDLAFLESWWPNHSAIELEVNWRTPRFGSLAYSAGYGLSLPLSPKVGYFGNESVRGWKMKLAITMPITVGDSGSPVLDRRGDLRALISGIVGTRNFEGAPIPVANKSAAVTGLDISTFLEDNHE